LYADGPETYVCSENGTAPLYVQTPTAATKSVVTFNDSTSFSCGVDDASTAPDACTM